MREQGSANEPEGGVRSTALIMSRAEEEGLAPTTVAAAEDAMRTRGERGSLEWWYFDARLDDSSTLVVNFMTKPLLGRTGPLKPRLEITVTAADGTTRRSFREHPPAAFSASRETCDVRIAESSVRGDLERYWLRARAEGVAVDLELTRIVRSWRPGGGRVYFDAGRTQYLGWVVAVPHGRVRGTVSVDGAARTVSGFGYHDHNWTNVALERPFDGWYWGRAQLGSYTFLFFEGHASKRWGHACLPIAMLAADSEVVLDGSVELRLDPGHAFASVAGCHYPETLTVEASSAQGSVKLVLEAPRVLERDDLLAALPWPLRWLLRPFVHPWYLRLSADADLTVTRPGRAPVQSRGRGVYELMAFRHMR